MAGQSVTYAPRAIPVTAWVPFRGGQEHQVDAMATAWTSDAVRIEWPDGRSGHWVRWVWAAAVRRR